MQSLIAQRLVTPDDKLSEEGNMLIAEILHKL